MYKILSFNYEDAAQEAEKMGLDKSDWSFIQKNSFGDEVSIVQY